MGYRYADAARLLAGTQHALRTQGSGEVVLSQDPLPGTRVESTRPVTVSLGFLDNRIMPDLTNNTLRDALLKLKNLGIEVEYTGNGRIIHQEPSVGTPVRQGQKCVLTLGWMG
jgi:cell division protein FtsI (penicillin-binding protein 3)/stage V sporulation protein D (sporulation-specific penicillin-binding protein)